MKTMKFLVALIFSVFAVNTACAFKNPFDNTLKLTIRNNSTEILHYTGVTRASSGSVFLIDSTDIFPGGEATVTATNSPYYDLAGELHFNDAQGNGNLLVVKDRRLFHYDQPVFSMSNNQFISFVESKEFNAQASENPRALSYVAAKVIIEKNPRNTSAAA